MKILIATGIFTPEIGGPATYVPLVAEQFLHLGHEVAVISYSDKTSYEQDKTLSYPVTRIVRSNKISNYWRYFRALFKLAPKYDLIYCFDHFSAGLPAATVSQIFGKPLYVRVGGDFIWERYVEHNSVTLEQYYEHGLYKKDINRFKLINWVFQTSRAIIFTTDWQKNIFSKYYNLGNKKLFVINNPIDQKLDIRRDENNISNDIIFAGRFINKNNIFNLIKAFVAWSQDKYKLVLIGEGPLKNKLENLIIENNYQNIIILDKLSRVELVKKMAQSWLVVFPSLSDISPNTMLDCVQAKIPFVSTQEMGFDWLKNNIKLFDPTKSAEITGCLEYLADENNYSRYTKNISELVYSYFYKQAAEDTIKIFENKNQ
ncbi:MAG: glycosyltransferase family 4 protein [Patescibacteria group bacterium]|jgi:glycosyltransferase involved in cell wall biosynthesis